MIFPDFFISDFFLLIMYQNIHVQPFLLLNYVYYYMFVYNFIGLKLLKSGMNDGFDGLTSDYLLNASPLLYEYLYFLFTCMVHHSFPPSTFCISTMIPIPKDFNKDVSKSQNYRGIALSSLFSKIFDYIMTVVYIYMCVCVQLMHQKILIVLIYLYYLPC